MRRHRIRLRRPWRHEATAQAVVWRRRFGRPSGLGDADTVWVCVDGTSLEGAVALNGQFLGFLPIPGTRARYDVSRQLLDRNELSVLTGTPHGMEDAATPPAEISLEICSPENSTRQKEEDSP